MKLTILNLEGKIQPKCCGCGCTEALIYGPCPFASEIYDDYTQVFLCENCYQNNCDDI